MYDIYIVQYLALKNIYPYQCYEQKFNITRSHDKKLHIIYF